MLRRAWRSGVIFNRRFLFGVNNRPIIFTLGFVAHIGIVVMRAAFAAVHTRMRFASSCSAAERRVLTITAAPRGHLYFGLLPILPVGVAGLAAPDLSSIDMR